MQKKHKKRKKNIRAVRNCCSQWCLHALPVWKYHMQAYTCNKNFCLLDKGQLVECYFNQLIFDLWKTNTECGKVKVNVDLCSALSWTSKALRYGTRSRGISEFYLYSAHSAFIR